MMTSRSSQNRHARQTDQEDNPLGPSNQPPPTPSTNAAANECQVVSNLGLNTQDASMISSAIFNILTALNVSTDHSKGKDPKIKVPASNLGTILTLDSHLKHILFSDSSLRVLVCKLNKQVTALSQDMNSCLDSMDTSISNATNKAAPTQTPPTPSSTWPSGALVTALVQPATPTSDTQLLLIQSNSKEPTFGNMGPKLIIHCLEQAIKVSNITNNSTTIQRRAVRVLASKGISITTHNKEDSVCLCSKEVWVKAASKALCLCQEVYPIVHHVPITFDPSSNTDQKELRDANPSALRSFKQMCWANLKKALVDSKHHSSLIIHVANPTHANRTIEHSISINGTLHATEKAQHALLQCHNCQQFSHTAVKCSRQLQPPLPAVGPPSCTASAELETEDLLVMLAEVGAELQSQLEVSTFQNTQMHKSVIDLVFTSPSAHSLYIKCDTDKTDDYNHCSNHFPIIHQILLDIPACHLHPATYRTRQTGMQSPMTSHTIYANGQHPALTETQSTAAPATFHRSFMTP
ncbi:hypothetical protein FRB95_014666 [Tulasnella sp. JGI-2019a]|nr:hypothetical protein FRB95_014666 [Tulasnella sp. JGI-2019a]